MIWDRCNDPPCPKCGCPQSDMVNSGTRWGRPRVRLRCTVCGSTWWTRPQATPAAEAETEQADHAVRFHVVRCPKCGGTDTRVTSTRRPVRYHRCKCGHTFKSVEK